MEYGRWWFGKFARATAHLSGAARAVYRHALDWVYLWERPLPADPRRVLRLLDLPETLFPELTAVLAEFFVIGTDEHGRVGYVQTFAWQQLAEFHEQVQEPKARSDGYARVVRARQKVKLLRQLVPITGKSFETLKRECQYMNLEAVEREYGELISGGPGSKGEPPLRVSVSVSRKSFNDNAEKRGQITPLDKGKLKINTACVPAREQPGLDPLSEPQQPTAEQPALTAADAMRRAGLGDADPSDARLAALLRDGVTVDALAYAAARASALRRGFGYALNVAARENANAQISGPRSLAEVLAHVRGPPNP